MHHLCSGPLTYSNYAGREIQEMVDPYMALSYLAQNQKWIEQTDQIRARNRGQFTKKN